MEQSNLECLKNITKEFLKENTEIKDRQQWQELLRNLCAHKIIQLDDLQSIDQCFLIFPISLEHFIRMITETFNDQKIKNLETNITKLTEQVNDSKSTISYWSSEGFDHKELQCLIIIYEKIKKEVQQIQSEFEDLNNNLQTTKENVLSIKDVFENQPQIGNEQEEEIETSCDYQRTDGFSIEKEYQSIRIRNVQYRNQKVKIIKINANGIVKQIGYDIDLDFPVEVTKIPKMFNDFEILENNLQTYDAHKQLVYSKYFPNYLGFNHITDKNYNLYFIEYIKGKNLKHILLKSTSRLKASMPLYRLWIREIFLGMKDLLQKSTYMPQLPIKLKNILVCDSGLKIVLKNIQFTSQRKLKQMSVEYLEARLLVNYAQLILSILGYTENDLEQFNSDLEFKTFIIGLLHAEIDLEKYLVGQVERRMEFEQLLNHHMLNENFIIETDVMDIVEDYEAIFENVENEQ